MKTIIREVAQRKGVTQKMLAEKLGVSLHTVKFYYISDKLALQTLERIAKVLECEPWNLLVSDYDMLKSNKCEVVCPECGKRIPVKDLEFCFDSL